MQTLRIGDLQRSSLMCTEPAFIQSHAPYVFAAHEVNLARIEIANHTQSSGVVWIAGSKARISLLLHLLHAKALALLTDIVNPHCTCKPTTFLVPSLCEARG